MKYLDKEFMLKKCELIGKFLCLGLRWTCLFVFLEHVSGYLFYHEEMTTTTCLWEQCLLFGRLTNRGNFNNDSTINIDPPVESHGDRNNQSSVRHHTAFRI